MPSALDLGVELIRKAANEDLKLNYAEAYKGYLGGIDYLLLAIKQETNEAVLAQIRSKTAEFLTRAETLKAHLNNEPGGPARQPPTSFSSESERQPSSDNRHPGMSPETSTLEIAIEILRKAVNADTENRYPEALASYRQGLDFMMLAVKYEKDPLQQSVLAGKVKEYLERAEKINAYLQAQHNPTITSSTSGSHINKTRTASDQNGAPDSVPYSEENSAPPPS
ncbi:hypothetical protein BKA62DRAFT_693074 [Auriculariales sp. MPI-PUGE-AT-0066]|nr:hypothetical protein BKA62DRAFT_693074 [Auriculariales sp. MPI-PUGE-AT-0066]